VYFALGLVGALLVFLASKNDYKKTYVASYQESEATRIHVAEHIRKLPMSFFNQKNLSELTTNIMGDCATSEHVLSHVIPQLIANGISVTIICFCFQSLTAACDFHLLHGARSVLLVLLSRKVK
jgi:ATP-binding cassette subfamily B protein